MRPLVSRARRSGAAALRAELVERAALRGRVELAGPVLAADDPTYRGVQVPLVFWKVLIYRPTGQDLRARAFLVTQSLKGL